jgi:integrase
MQVRNRLWTVQDVAATRGTLRDPDNTRKRLREVVAGTEWEGLHPHAFRHLVVTRLDASGLSAREIADYLGTSASR